MLRALILIGMMLLSRQILAGGKAEYCARVADGPSFQRLIGIWEVGSMAFRNNGGLLNGGVCWWHSRFHRSATYLAVFRPELPRPDEDTAKKIIRDIAKNERVVEIPGHDNLHQFSDDWETEIQDYLEAWQKKDGFIRQAWVSGLAGKVKKSPERLKKIMDETYAEVAGKGRIVYHKLQIKGIESHAWLVTGMTKTGDGYRMSFVDSNYSQKQTLDYTYGDRSLNDGHRDIGPNIGQENDFKDIEKAQKEYCKQ